MEKPISKSVFATLSAIDCGEHIEKKRNGQTELSYLSWAWAWHYIKSNYPDAFYTIYETTDGVPYWTDGRTCWVKTGVTIQGLEHIEYLPIMDYRNQSIPVDRVTSMDMNKAIQRSLTKAAARHGCGLYVYAGEDLPLSEEEAKAQEAQQAEEKPAPKKAPAKKAAAQAAPAPAPAPAPNKKEAPARGSEVWNKWVKAIATDAPSKTGQKVDWKESFKKQYLFDQDVFDCLEEDVFNYMMDNPRTNA